MIYREDSQLFESHKLTDGCIAKFNRYGVKFLSVTTDKARTLTAGDYSKLGKYGNYLQSEFDCRKVRKLTIVEYCRLQTVPDDYFKVSSQAQAYKMLGNGWTVDVIAHIIKEGLQ